MGGGALAAVLADQTPPTITDHRIGPLPVHGSAPVGPGGTVRYFRGANLGGYISYDDAVDLFPDVQAGDAVAGTPRYQCFFVRNVDEQLVVGNVGVWQAGPVASCVLTFGADPAAPSDYDSADPQALTIPDSATAPDGVVFTPALSRATAVPLPDIGPGQVAAFWVCRTPISTAPVAEQVAIRVSGDSPRVVTVTFAGGDD